MKSVLTASNLQKIILLLVLRQRRKLHWQTSEFNKIKNLCLLYSKLKKKENEKTRIWVSELYKEKNRLLQGGSQILLNTMKIYDQTAYYNFMRMNPQLFEKLLSIVGAKISKQDVVRTPISPTTRLQLTLRYLATGDCMKSLAYLFRLSHSSVTKIIPETCTALWETLRPIVFPQLTENVWKEIAKGFEKKWNFPHCIGAVDGKLVNIQAPPHSGSFFYDYKGRHSIHFMAYVDAYKKFIIVDVGAAGRQSDGGIFNNSETGKRLKIKQLNIPPPSPIVPGGFCLPYVFIGDEAFALSRFMLRPYPRSSEMSLKKKVFNYRLSRARRIVEASFGTLTSVWRIFRSPMKCSLVVSIEAVKACICLHNYLILFDNNRKYNITEKASESNLENIFENFPLEQSLNEISKVTEIREKFADYFFNEGAVSFQWEKAMNGDF